MQGHGFIFSEEGLQSLCERIDKIEIRFKKNFKTNPDLIKL